MNNAARDMDLFEAALAQLSALELLYQLEELTIILITNTARHGDFEKQMLVKRVILRKMATANDTLIEAAYERRGYIATGLD